MAIVRGGANDYHRCEKCGHPYFIKKELYVLSKDRKLQMGKKTFYYCENCGEGWELKNE